MSTPIFCDHTLCGKALDEIYRIFTQVAEQAAASTKMAEEMRAVAEAKAREAEVIFEKCIFEKCILLTAFVSKTATFDRFY